MNEPVPSASSAALAELLDVSPQVDAAVILERDGGRILASAPTANERMADRFGATCTKIVAAAERARTELGREPVSQVEVATPDGHVFVVADATWVVAAVTDADPTVGLVFYDLKTALRAVREAAGTPALASPAVDTSPGDEPQGDGGDLATAPIVTPLRPSGDDEEDGRDGGTSPGDDAPNEQGASRWRRRKS